jgi:transcriptional regulator with GAF, ATPase, and Fis domain
MLELTYPDSDAHFEFSKEADVLTIGRADSNKIVIDNPHVSALHAQIICRDGNYFFQDLNSTNGSAIERDNERIAVDAGNPAGIALQKGDRILLGSQAVPAILLVVRCSLPGHMTRPAATIVATRRLAPAAEVGERIESLGGTLLPFLSLSEKLSLASTQAQAFEAFSGCLRSVIPEIRQITVAEPAQPYSQPVWSEPDTQDTIQFLLPEQSDEKISVTANTDGGCCILAPVRFDHDSLLWIAAQGRGDGFEAGEIDSASLACSLLAARLRQLQLVVQLENARSRLTVKNRYLREKSREQIGFEMVGASPAMTELTDQIAKVAPTDATVLISGPSGSGKELVARRIHALSPRHAEIFAALNCGALVEGLLESELFGCRKGAFTGANRDREGLFEVAHGGTLFLDEIGDMSPALQVKLLRVLETRELTPVGDTRPRRVDVRVLAATNRDLGAEVSAGRFREDLFYRINVFPLAVPALSDRREDIPLLVRHFLGKFEASGRPACTVSDEALRFFSARDYPGNIRQLSNLVQRAMLLAQDSGRILPEHIGGNETDCLAAAASRAGRGKLKEQVSRVERILILQALERNGGNRTQTSKALGITRQALLLKLKRYGIN